MKKLIIFMMFIFGIFSFSDESMLNKVKGLWIGQNPYSFTEIGKENGKWYYFIHNREPYYENKTEKKEIKILGNGNLKVQGEEFYIGMNNRSELALLDESLKNEITSFTKVEDWEFTGSNNYNLEKLAGKWYETGKDYFSHDPEKTEADYTFEIKKKGKNWYMTVASKKKHTSKEYKINYKENGVMYIDNFSTGSGARKLYFAYDGGFVILNERNIIIWKGFAKK